MTITIIKTDSGKFKVKIRSNNRLLKTKTFKRKTDARAWANRWEREYERICELGFEASYPSDATIDKLHDEMDFQRAVQAYLSTDSTIL